jgi:hypothetical protein
VAAESGYATWAPRGVRILGATVVQANQGDVGHGAVLVHSDRTDTALGGQPLDDVLIRDVTIKDTPVARGYDVRVSTDGGAALHRVVLENVAITGGPATALVTDQDAATLTTRNWTKDGAPITPLSPHGFVVPRVRCT